ncbi:hypothetical protein RISK_004788 [Rhodopirellula islandica]|uniref:Uncharacterized protein n=1 Tax=Rhodopirellula islandica TaxID=595434 RepID=A0A0J1EBZ9_RHOIS|nr:hypothetical protein RISK_004788 [Rhodopirellula islandica]
MRPSSLSTVRVTLLDDNEPGTQTFGGKCSTLVQLRFESGVVRQS